MNLEDATVIGNEAYQGDYRLLVLDAPGAAAAAPGQFVHLRIPWLEGTALRRPFSIFDAAEGRLSILYKPVGRGTRFMLELTRGREVSVLGPLGKGFPIAADSGLPVAVAGGYGVAPLSFLAGRLGRRGIVFIGGRSEVDILCADRFETLGWDVRIATEDGSMGEKGLVTESVARWATEATSDDAPVLFACGPDGMLHAVGDLALQAGWQAWLSLDKRMGCGVGACLACVQALKMEDGSVARKRVCREGPVFSADRIVWE